MLLGHGKVAEDDEEDEEIVNAEGEFKQVAGCEFESGLAALPEKEQSSKNGGEHDPHGAPRQRLLRANHTAATGHHQKVEHQHSEREQIEENPEIEQWASFAGYIVDC